MVHGELKISFFAVVQFSELSTFDGNNVSSRRRYASYGGDHRGVLMVTTAETSRIGRRGDRGRGEHLGLNHFRPVLPALDLDVSHHHGQHLFMHVDSRYPVSHRYLLAGAESALRLTLSRVAGYRRSTGERQSPFTRPIMHAPDQTAEQPRLLHSCFDLATRAADYSAPNRLISLFMSSRGPQVL